MELVLREEWEKLTPRDWKNCVESMQRRYKAVIHAQLVRSNGKEKGAKLYRTNSTINSKQAGRPSRWYMGMRFEETRRVGCIDCGFLSDIP